MKLKTVEIEGKQYAEIKDGMPVYSHEDGQERPFDAVHTSGQIKSLNYEGMERRKALEEAEKKLKLFDSISDPDAALAALETVKNLDDKNLVDAGQVDQIKQEVVSAMEAKFEPERAENKALKDQLRKLQIGGAFSRSKFISDKLAIPADMVEATFGKNFAVDGPAVVAKDNSGNPIFSKERPGEPADFEEAIQVLVDNYPHKDSILKGTNASGASTEAKSVQPGVGSLKGANDRSDRISAISKKFPDLPTS